jgi:hypothetical protein
LLALPGLARLNGTAALAEDKVRAEAYAEERLIRVPGGATSAGGAAAAAAAAAAAGGGGSAGRVMRSRRADEIAARLAPLRDDPILAVRGLPAIGATGSTVRDGTDIVYEFFIEWGARAAEAELARRRADLLDSDAGGDNDDDSYGQGDVGRVRALDSQIEDLAYISDSSFEHPSSRRRAVSKDTDG